MTATRTVFIVCIIGGCAGLSCVDFTSGNIRTGIIGILFAIANAMIFVK